MSQPENMCSAGSFHYLVNFRQTSSQENGGSNLPSSGKVWISEKHGTLVTLYKGGRLLGIEPCMTWTYTVSYGMKLFLDISSPYHYVTFRTVQAPKLDESLGKFVSSLESHCSIHRRPCHGPSGDFVECFEMEDVAPIYGHVKEKKCSVLSQVDGMEYRISKSVHRRIAPSCNGA